VTQVENSDFHSNRKAGEDYPCDGGLIRNSGSLHREERTKREDLVVLSCYSHFSLSFVLLGEFGRTPFQIEDVPVVGLEEKKNTDLMVRTILNQKDPPFDCCLLVGEQADSFWEGN
jgi:hypothetical protein